MVSGLFRIALSIGLLMGALYYFSPSSFSRVVHVDYKEWAMNVLSKLHLNLSEKGGTDYPIHVIVRLLQNEKNNEGVQRLAGLHRAIQKLTITPLCQEVELERSIGELDALDTEVMASLRGLNGCELQGEVQNRARTLEQILLTRIHELIVWRKSCEASHQHALNDLLPENAMLPVAESASTPPDGKTKTANAANPLLLGDLVPGMEKAQTGESDSEISMRSRELEKKKAQLKAADTTRRRELFSQGARQRWRENSARLKAQIQEDLKRLDVLMASAVL